MATPLSNSRQTPGYGAFSCLQSTVSVNGVLGVLFCLHNLTEKVQNSYKRVTSLFMSL